MADYVCIRDCYHRRRRYRPGDPYTPLDDEQVPHHFAPSGTPVPQPETPRLGQKVQGAVKHLPSVKAPGKEDLAKGKGPERSDLRKGNRPSKEI